MKPRRVYTLSSNQEVHRITRAVFNPPNYICEVLNDFKILLDSAIQTPHVLTFDLTTHPEAQVIDFSLKYIDSYPDILINFIGYEAHLDLLNKLPRKNVFDLLICPITLNQVLFLANRLDTLFALRERLEHQVSESRRLIEKLPVPTVVLSSNLTVSLANESAKRVFGFTGNSENREFAVDNLVERIVPGDRTIFAEALKRAFSAGLTSAVKIEVTVGKEGHAIIPLKVFPVWSDPSFSEEPEVFIIADYEELFPLEQADIFQKEKLSVLGELSAEIAHEIRNSLMSIGGFVQIMGHANQEGSKETILAEVKRLERFLTSVREYTRPALNIRDTDLKDLIGSILQLMGPELKKYGVSQRLSIHREGERIETSPDILKQVIINLIKNAIRAMPRGGILEITTFDLGDKIGISISDQGTGIEESQESLFVPISRGGKSIGLPISYKLIKRLGGSINLETSSSGTTFTLLLPKDRTKSNEENFQVSNEHGINKATSRPERRSDRRFSVSLMACCLVRDREVDARIINLSKTGLLLKIAVESSKFGEPERIEFDIPSIHTARINRMRARIIPVHKRKRNGEMLIGCRFQPEEQISQYWHRYIRELHLYQRN